MSVLLKRELIIRWYHNLKQKYDMNDHEYDLIIHTCTHCNCHSKLAPFYKNQLDYLHHENVVIGDLLDDIEIFYNSFIT